MSKHSIKVPRLYKVSAQVAKEVSEGIGSIKNLVYEKQKKHPNIKAIYALVSTLFQKTAEIETLLKRSQLLSKEPRFDIWLAKVLIVELIWGKKKLPGQSKPENTLRAYEQIFKAHLSDETPNETHTKENVKPRYVRVNTLVISFDEAVEGFRDEGWTLMKFLDKSDYNGYLEKVLALNEAQFMIDIHVPNLLVFPPRTEFYNHVAYKNGSILLQDKASCLPVHILGPPPGSTVLDMCAAPGMKTTHLAAVLNDQGTIYATERNPKRFETLCRLIETAGAKCIKTFNKDILECSKEDFPDVEYILVDPSCSGTGMTNRSQEDQLTESRMASLTGFQIKILRHALTKFPNVKRVVYSTCSVLPEENEDVVRQVLETNYNFKLIPANQLVGNTWRSFGSPDFGDIGKFCLYAKPSEDFTNGFFVAVFERVAEGEENVFFNSKIFNFKKHIQANEKWKEKKQNQKKKIAGKYNNAKENDDDHSTCNNPKHDMQTFSQDVKDEGTNYVNLPRNKKHKGEHIVETQGKVLTSEEIDVDTVKPKKKKKKSKYGSEEICSTMQEEEIQSDSPKKRKKRQHVDVTEVEEQTNLESVETTKKKKKKKKQQDETQEEKLKYDECVLADKNSKRKKLKVDNSDSQLYSKKKKKNKRKTDANEET